MEIRGCWQDGVTSASEDVTLVCDDSGLLYVLEQPSVTALISEIEFSPRIGNTARYLRFADGGQFESKDNDSIDALLKSFYADSRINSSLHRFESRWQYIIASLAFVVVFCWVFLQFSLPSLAKTSAYFMPAAVAASVGQGTLTVLDNSIFESTSLSEGEQQEWRDRFLPLLPDDEFNYQLLFRDGGSIGANAFALPDGTIVVTDQLVSLASDHQEVESVLLHEIGHVRHRHSLRFAIEQSSLAILITLITGDVSAASSLIAVLPTLLVQMGYAREHEWQADGYALQQMLANDINPIYFSRMMNKIQHDSGGQEESAELSSPSPDKKEGSWGNYLLTHPVPEKRVQRFKQAARENGFSQIQ